MLTRHSVKIQTVTELTSSIRGLLETEFPFVSVSGEISNLRKPQSGHLYFTLKDSEAQIRSVLFKQQLRYLDVQPEDGLQVVCRGRISVYEPRGDYQLIIDTIELLGSGKLQAEYDKLKLRLSNEGLFDTTAKKPVPEFPDKVTIITSPDGAAVHDFIRTAHHRFPGFPLEIFPTRVQGEAAAEEIAAAIVMINERTDTDIIVLCRGGGSLEDLWAFNEEVLARSIFASDIPIVSAIGHEIDFTISDFVADLRAATPTAAAESVIPNKTELKEWILNLDRRLAESLLQMIESHRYRVLSHKRLLRDPSILVDIHGLRLKNSIYDLTNALNTLLSGKDQKLTRVIDSLKDASPQRELINKKQRVAELLKLSSILTTQALEKQKEKLRRSASLLDAVSPLAVLGRGYSLTMSGKKEVVRDSDQLEIGDDIEVILDKGSIDARVTGKSHGVVKKRKQ